MDTCAQSARRIGGVRRVARLREEAIMTDTRAIDSGSSENRAIDELAARWHAREMSGRFSPEDAQHLDTWLAADVRHRLAYADVAAAGYAFQQAAPVVAIESVR